MMIIMAEEKQLPKILVGCPTSDYKAYCFDEYIKALKSLTYPNIEFLIADNSEEPYYAKRFEEAGFPVVRVPFEKPAMKRVVAARNVIRQKVVEGDYKYYFSLEQDVIPPPDIIEKLLARKEWLVSGLYFSFYNVDGQRKKCPLFFLENDTMSGTAGTPVKPGNILLGQNITLQFDIDEPTTFEPPFFRVKAAGLGCMLIHRYVMENIPFRFVSDDTTDDFAFCEDAFRKGFDVYVDSDLRCDHLSRQFDWTSI